jgi:hypothetical protein
MFDATSRYAQCETAVLKVKEAETSDGPEREIRYARRRFVPSAEGTTTLVEHTVSQGDRLDNVTVRYLGDPTQFWRVCDANEAMDPRELEAIGRTTRVAMSDL